MEINKIFGVGLSKTGTTSLTRALRILGFKATHCPFFALDHFSPTLALRLEKIARRDAFTDSPIPLFYRELDAAFPGSKFILTIRDRESWLDSCQNHHVWPGNHIQGTFVPGLPLVRTQLMLHKNLYGSERFDRDGFTASYESHRRSVLDFFAERPADLLVIDLCGGEGWEQLCPFLNKPVPDRPFPRLNVGAQKAIKRGSRKWFWTGLSALDPRRVARAWASART
jgi:hypothetical protein